MKKILYTARALIAILYFTLFLLTSSVRANLLSDILEHIPEPSQEDLLLITRSYADIERILHDEIVAAIETRFYTYQPKELECLGWALAAASSRPPLPGGENPWSFKVVRTSDKNAFAVPGGAIYITDSLYQRILQEEEEKQVEMLGFILGHEIAHIVCAHWQKNMERQTGYSLMQWIASKLIPRGKIAAFNTIFEMVLGAIDAGYSREYEREADSLGVVYMTKLGASYEGAIQLMREFDTGRRTCLFWCTHPQVSERIELIRRVGERRQAELERIEEQMKISKPKVGDITLSKDVKSIEDCVKILEGALKNKDFEYLHPYSFFSDPQNYKKTKTGLMNSPVHIKLKI